jgi:hypothetical protein
VNKVKIKVFQLESLQRSLNGGANILRTVMGVPELAGNKDLVARNLGLSESLTNFMFILICGPSKFFGGQFSCYKCGNCSIKGTLA